MNRTWWALLAAIAGHVLVAPYVDAVARLLAATALVLTMFARCTPVGVVALAALLGAAGGLRLRSDLPSAGVPPPERATFAIELESAQGDGQGTGWVRVEDRVHRIRLEDLPDSLGPGSRFVAEVDQWWPLGRRNPDDRDPRRSALAKGPLRRGRVRSIATVIESAPPTRRARLRARGRAASTRWLGGSAPLWRALLLADRADLDPTARDRFARLGLAHLLALSGLHVGIVAGVMMVPLRRWGRRGMAWALPALFAWAWAAGAGASLVRAVGMLAWWVGARALGRPARALDAIAALALVESVLRPNQLTSIGWWLSYAATTAILRALPSLVTRKRWLAPVLLSTVAQSATAPWALDAFGRWVWVGPWVQLLVCVPFAILLGAGVALVTIALVLPPIAGPALALLAVASHAFGALLAGIEWIAPSPMGHPGLGSWWPAALVALLLWLPPWHRCRRARLGATVVLVLLPHIGLVKGPRETWTTLDVGQGDASVYRRGGETLVIDAGPRTPRRNAGARVVLPYLERRNRSRALLALTHGHLDHIGGASVLLRSGRIEQLVLARCDSTEHWARDLVTLAQASGARAVFVAAGDTLELGSVGVPVLWPPGVAGDLETNDRSLVLELGPRDRALLAPGDLERAGERALRSILAASPTHFAVLKVAHHGGDTGSDEPLLGQLSVRWALLSCGSGNRYGHPHAEVLERLDAAGARALRTDRRGALIVHWRADGSEVEVRTVRPIPLASGPP